MITLKVLAVDDEVGMRSGIKRALSCFQVEIPEAEETVQFQILEAGTGEDAVECIRTETPDILLLDYKLPGMSGLEVLNETATDNADFLTIMITAYASIETAIAATKRGAYDFLPKPFTPSDLKHAVRKATTRLVLARRARELKEANRRVRFEFIRVLGHELKAPIAAVSGYLYLMRDHTLGTDMTAYDEPVNRSLQRLEQMRKLIMDLLDMTRLESGQKRRELEPVNVTEAARSAIELMSTSAAQREITLALDSKEEITIHADRGEMDMMFNNLVSNAVKYNRDGGNVNVAVEQVDGQLQIAVSDTGIGMTPEEVDRLFGEFVRIKNEQTRNVLGSGLGLSILKRLAQLYDGDVTVESEEGKGSTFTVTLKTLESTPAAEEEEQETP